MELNTRKLRHYQVIFSLFFLSLLTPAHLLRLCFCRVTVRCLYPVHDVWLSRQPEAEDEQLDRSAVWYRQLLFFPLWRSFWFPVWRIPVVLWSENAPSPYLLFWGGLYPCELLLPSAACSHSELNKKKSYKDHTSKFCPWKIRYWRLCLIIVRLIKCHK